MKDTKLVTIIKFKWHIVMVLLIIISLTVFTQKKKFIRDYGYMKDFLYEKLRNEGDKNRYHNLFYFNEILDSTNLKKYIENCLDTEKISNKLYYCITRYPIINKNKEEVLRKIQKFKDAKNTGCNEGYNVVVHGYARNKY